MNWHETEQFLQEKFFENMGVAMWFEEFGFSTGCISRCRDEPTIFIFWTDEIWKIPEGKVPSHCAEISGPEQKQEEKINDYQN